MSICGATNCKRGWRSAAPPRPVIEAGGWSDESMTASCHASWTKNPDADVGKRCMAVSLLPQLSLLNDRENAAGQANRLSIS